MKQRPSEPVVLALDIGTSSVRSALFDEKARVVRGSRARVEYRVKHSAAHSAELDPAALLRATKRCLRLTKSPVHSAAGSGFWHSLLGLDRAGNPLTPIYTWADSRCAPDAAELREKLDERTIHQRTGCMLRASYWPAKLLWLRRTERALFRRVARWVSPAEWIFEQIFGVCACSHSMASGTGLYQLAAGDWDHELLEQIGLTNKHFNPLRDQVENFFSPIGDGAASNLGSGASLPGMVAINVGTSAAVRTIPALATPLPFGLFRYVIDRQRTLVGGAISNAGNLRAWCRRQLNLPPNDGAIERLLRASADSSSALTVLPFWVGERAPTWPENLDGTIAGLTQATTAADLLRATTAATFFRLAEILDLLESVTGPAKKIIVSGGILQSPASLQLLADSLGRGFITTADQEASLRGAAVYALEHAGDKISPPPYGVRVRPDKKAAAQAREKRRRQMALEELLSDRAL